MPAVPRTPFQPRPPFLTLPSSPLPLDPSQQVWVYGDSYQSKLLAVVHPKQHNLEAWAKGKGKRGESSAPQHWVVLAPARHLRGVTLPGWWARALPLSLHWRGVC